MGFEGRCLGAPSLNRHPGTAGSKQKQSFVMSYKKVILSAHAILRVLGSPISRVRGLHLQGEAVLRIVGPQRWF